jgi:minor extracellular serine protease Vpr
MRYFLAFLGGLGLLLAGPLLAQRRPAFVVLGSAPIIEHLAATPRETSVRERLFTAEAKSYQSALRVEKAALVARMQQHGIVVDWQIETVLNAVLIEATAEDLVWLRTEPGITTAEFAPKFHVHLDAAASLISAPAVWNSLGGSANAGRGVLIGIIDSGIEQTHPMFADSGFTAPSGFPVSDTAADKAYTNNKVIVARNYVCPSTVSGTCTTGSANLNASDGLGHGTFVASVAAGISVITPYNTTISGIAPGAYLGNYKVFDSSGSASGSAIFAAIDAAVSDGMDLLNFSGGSEPAPKAAADPYTTYVNTALNNAATGGTLMVVAAGNCGPDGEATTGTGAACVTDGDFTISSPGELPSVLTAGASTNAHALLDPFHVTSPAPVPANLQSMGFAPGTAPAFSSNVGPATLVDITPLDSTSQACGTLPAGSLTGSIAVIKRGICTFVVKVATAAGAGAIAVLLYDDVKESLLTPITTGSSIPSGFITEADGANLLAFLQANPSAQGQLGDTPAFVPQQADLVESYSSRGPTPDYNIKPDLVAPGDMYAAAQSLYSSAEIYDPSGFIYAEGTSFATPMTTGSAAVLRAARPTLAPADIKSALVNAATPISGTQDGAEISVINMGAGRLNLLAAMNTPLVANPVSVSFGLISASASTSQTVVLKNVGQLSDTFVATINPILGGSAVQVTTSPTSIPLPAGQSGTMNIQMVANSAQGVFEGFVTITGQQSGLAIHIPYWVMFGPPAVSTGGVTDGAGFGQNVAAGSIISLFGTALGGVGVQASTIPLPTDLAHSVVTITSGGTTSEAPMFYSSSGQLNLQLPFTAIGSTSATVSLEGVKSSTVSFPVAGAAPGVFNYGGGIGVVLHANNSLVTAANPAAANETVVIYCTGLGTVIPAVTSGFAAPSSPLSQTPQFPTVTVGGQTAGVQYSGLASGFVGLYQVNAMLPSNLAAGTQNLTLTMAGNTSNSVTISIQ